MEELLNWKDFYSTFIGAVAGSGVIIGIEWSRRQNLKVARLNSFKVKLHVLLESIISSKRDEIDPLVQNYRYNVSIHESNSQPQKMEILINEFIMPNLKIDLDDDLINLLSSRNGEFLIAFQRLSRRIHYLEMTYEKWNSIYNEILKLTIDERNRLYFGIAVGGTRYSTVQNCIDTLDMISTACLVEANKLRKNIDKMSLSSIPWVYRKNLTKITLEEPYKKMFEDYDAEFAKTGLP